MIKAASNPLEINTQSAPSFPTYNPAQQNRTFMAGASMPPQSVQVAQTSPTHQDSPSIPNNPTGAVMPSPPKFPDPTQTNLVRADGSTASVDGSDGNGDKPGQQKKKLSFKMAIGVIVLFLVVLGSGAGFYLTQQSQDLRQQASCTEECPGSDGVLRNCSEPILDPGNTQSLCNSNFTGRREYCGGVQYCCPGTTWTTNLSACPEDVVPTSCNDACTTNTECTNINSSWTCDATSNKCRLASNPTSITCTAAAALNCNDSCTTNTQCTSVNSAWTCDATSNKCRLASNPTSISCAPAEVVLSCNDACTTNTQCSSVNPAWSCDASSNKCRLTANPTSLTCQPAAEEELACNDSCTTDAQCTDVDTSWTCDATSNKCRLASNPTSTTCQENVDSTCNDKTSANSCDAAGCVWFACVEACHPEGVTLEEAGCDQECTEVYCEDGTPPGQSCNTTCTVDSQCSNTNPGWSCDETSNKCRLTTNPTSTTCAALVNTVACDEFTGTLTAGTVANQTTEMNFRLEYSGDEQVTSAQVTIHGNFDGPGWVDTWADLSVDNTLSDGILTGITTYEDIIDLLVATGHDRQEIIDEGVIYSADVYGVNGFCQSDDTLSISGEECEFNSECQGIIKLKAVDETELECNDSCTTDDQCTDVNDKWTCDTTTDKCRLKSNPTSASCQVKIINDDSDDAVDPIVGCNETCVSNIDCTNDNHICVTTADGSNKCRLESYTSSTSCVIPAGATPQPSLPATLPETGPENWINWLKAGLTTIGIGAVLFFLL